MYVFIFYLVQYSLTSLNIFLILLAFGYLINKYIYSMNINSNTAFGTLNNNNHEKYSQTSTLIREWKKEESISLSLKREVEEKYGEWGKDKDNERGRGLNMEMISRDV